MTEDPAVYAELKEKEERGKRKSEGKGKRGRPKKIRTATAVGDSSEDEQGLQPVDLNDSSEYSDEVAETDEVEAPSHFINKEPEVGDFVLTKFDVEEGRFKGKRKLHYIGQVQEVPSSAKLSIRFLRLTSVCGNVANFHFPDVNDASDHPREQVVGVLQKPKPGLTRRLSGLFRFPLLDEYNIR